MDMIEIRRRVLMAIKEKKEGRLPDEYQEVEYIASSGTQYINVSTTEKEREFEIIFMPTAKRTNVAMFTGGSLYNDSSGTAAIIWTNGVGIRRIMNSVSGNGASMAINDAINKKIHFKCYKNLAEMSDADAGIIISTNANVVDSLYQIPIFLFYGGSNGAYRTRYTTGRFYYAKYLLNGALEAELIPCYRKSDGEIGVYDMVGKGFYANSGSGTFIKGNDIN